MESVVAADGHRLAVSRFTPHGPCRANVLIAGAMGVRQDYYAPFAEHLAAEGFAVTTFDYRGMGFSRSGSLRGFDTDIITWAEQDVDAMIGAARVQDAPLHLVSHSLGGQILGLVPRRHEVDAMFTVASGTGYYKHNTTMPLKVRFLWYVAMPLYTRIFGYFPGKKLRKVGDLPRGVALQWARWCRHPEYIVDEQGSPMRDGHANIRIPIFGLSFEDDEYIPKTAIDQLHGFYREASVERRHVEPQEVGARRIGHFGFFKPQFRNSLWPIAFQWLAGQRART
jgi:predicted alpha/beta hydrolase